MCAVFCSDRAAQINFENDPLVKELFGEPVRRRRTDAELAAWRQSHHKAAESTVARKAERDDSQQRGQVETVPAATHPSDADCSPELSSSGSSAARAKAWLVGLVFHPRQVHVKPTAQAPLTTGAANDDDVYFVTEYKRLSYDKFANLLKRKVLPEYLKQVQTGQSAQGCRRSAACAGCEEGQ